MGVKITSGLKFDDTIFYKEDGQKRKMVIHIRMNDECKNNICDFAITADIYELHRSSWKWHGGGCQHETILEHAPQYKCFVDLHNCNHYGYPTYAIQNSMYFFKRKDYNTVKNYLRLQEGELEELLLFSDDELAFQWKLNQMGIIDRWYQEALEAIEYLDELTGYRWINPYSKEEERFVMKPLDDEENRLMEERFTSGYYTKEQVEERREKDLNKKIDEQIAEAIEKFNEATSRWQEILNIKFSILNEGILLDNVIVYEHSKEVTFNWKDYEVQVSREDFDRYVAKMKELCLFEDWKFNFGKDKK